MSDLPEPLVTPLTFVCSRQENKSKQPSPLRKTSARVQASNLTNAKVSFGKNNFQPLQRLISHPDMFTGCFPLQKIPHHHPVMLVSFSQRASCSITGKRDNVMKAAAQESVQYSCFFQKQMHIF